MAFCGNLVNKFHCRAFSLFETVTRGSQIKTLAIEPNCWDHSTNIKHQTSNTIKKFERMFQWKSWENPRLPCNYTQPIQSLYSTLIREIILQVRKLFIVFLTTCVLLWLFYFILSLHFTPGLQSAVCSLHFTLSLHFTPGLQSAVCSLRFTLTGNN